MADTPGDEAVRRAQELLRRGSDLAAHKFVTEDDVKRAAERAEHAHERDQAARERAVHRHYAAGGARRELRAAQEADRQDA